MLYAVLVWLKVPYALNLRNSCTCLQRVCRPRDIAASAENYEQAGRNLQAFRNWVSHPRSVVSLNSDASEVPAPKKPEAPGPEDCCQVRHLEARTFLLQHSVLALLSATFPKQVTDSTARKSQSGCVECVWEVYQRELMEYQRSIAKAKGQPPPVDPFEELERQLYSQNNDRSAAKQRND